PPHPPVGLTPRTLPALAAARLLHEAVFRQRPQVKGAVRRRLTEHLAGLRRGERPRVAERLEQRPSQRVSQRSHRLRVGQVELQPIVARTRPIPIPAGPIPVGPIPAGPIPGRFIVSPAFASLLFARLLFVSPIFVSPIFVSPIFGSHVSEDYSRKSRFDKPSEHFFRENSSPAISGRAHPSRAPGGAGAGRGRHADRGIHPRRRR